MNPVIEFRINGTHNGQEINPLPKLKMTGKQFWMPRAQEYVKWKGWVCAAFFDAKFPNSVIERGDFGDAHDLMQGKAITLKKGQKARMDIKIHWNGGVHGDPENIFGSIADALFKNDKNLAGSFDFEDGADDRAWVDVRIELL